MAAPAGGPRRPNTVRLLLDETYPARLAELLREAGHDVLGVVEVPELVGQPDAEVARWARSAGRVVVTENVADFAPLDAGDHAGLLLVHGRRRPRTRSGIPRLATALGVRLAEAGPSADGQAPVSWL